MAYSQIDPARLDGDALTRWYLRSPDDIEQERQDAAAQRYRDFFGGNGEADPDSAFDAGTESPTQDVDPGFNGKFQARTKDVAPSFSWVPVGPNRWRGLSTASDDMSLVPEIDASTDAYAGPLDGSGAGPGDSVELPLARGSGFRPRASVAALSALGSAVGVARATPGASAPAYRSQGIPPPNSSSLPFGVPAHNPVAAVADAFHDWQHGPKMQRPNLAESFIPVVGPAWEAAADLQDGNYGGAAFQWADGGGGCATHRRRREGT